MVQEGSEPFGIYFQSAVVADIALLPELIHEVVYPRATGADHSRQSGLAQRMKGGSGRRFLSSPTVLHENPRQPSFTRSRIEPEIRQVHLELNSLRDQVFDQEDRQDRLSCEPVTKDCLLNAYDRARAKRCSRGHSPRSSCWQQAAFAKDGAFGQDAEHSLLAPTFVFHRESYDPLFDVEEIVGWLCLRIDDFLVPVNLNTLSRADSLKESAESDAAVRSPSHGLQSDSTTS
jgi:hypothetical protein